MILAFYSVDNSLGYERHTFDNMTSAETLEMLEKLPDGEVHFYNSSTYSWRTRRPGLEELQEDFNDEILDGGFWLVVLNAITL